MREADWKVFRRLVPEWRKRYLERVNRELVDVLQEEGRTPTDRFWDVQRRTKLEAQALRDCFDGHSRAKVSWYLLMMHIRGVITSEDLAEFSAELRERVETQIGVLQE